MSQGKEFSSWSARVVKEKAIIVPSHGDVDITLFQPKCQRKKQNGIRTGKKTFLIKKERRFLLSISNINWKLCTFYWIPLMRCDILIFEFDIKIIVCADRTLCARALTHMHLWRVVYMCCVQTSMVLTVVCFIFRGLIKVWRHDNMEYKMAPNTSNRISLCRERRNANKEIWQAERES